MKLECELTKCYFYWAVYLYNLSIIQKNNLTFSVQINGNYRIIGGKDATPSKFFEIQQDD